MKKILLLLFICTLLQSCVATMGTHKGEGGDNLFGITDPIFTSKENPEARTKYLPGKGEQRYINNDKDFIQLERNYYYIKTAFKPDTEAVIQKTNEDCWAACSIMLLKHEKVQFPVDKVEKLREELLTAKKAKDELSIFLKMLNSYKKISFSDPITRAMLVDSLANGHPVLVGFKNSETNEGHIRIAFGCYFSFIKPNFMDGLVKRDYNMAVDKVLLLDPADGKTMEMSGETFKRTAQFGISFSPIGGVSFMGFEY